MYTIHRENNTAVIYYVLQMNEWEPVCAHSHSKILIENNSIWHIKHQFNYIK